MAEDPDSGGTGERSGQRGGRRKKLTSAHEVYELLVGEIGVNRREFLMELRLWEIRAIVRGYRRRAALTWEPARFQTYAWLSARGAKSIHRPQDVLTFPWEKKKGTELTDDEIDDLRNMMRAANEARKNGNENGNGNGNEGAR